MFALVNSLVSCETFADMSRVMRVVFQALFEVRSLVAAPDAAVGWWLDGREAARESADVG